jgi:predicted phage baseplate assembly protein
MTCDPVEPCGEVAPVLAVVPPPPGLRYLTRRLGDFSSFLADAIATTERQPDPPGTLGQRWDLAGDPRGRLLAELWAYVAEGVAAYTELTASEAYLGTAQDWDDLRRLAGLVGYRPRPGIAATGWVQVAIDKGTNPLVPAGTRVQAPALAPERPKAQPFEVIADTPLFSAWAGMTATWVPQAAAPTGREVRFLGDPGFRAGDRVLFVKEASSLPPPAPGDWLDFWRWLLEVLGFLGVPAVTPLAVAKVENRSDDLGTTLVTFDRDLSTLLLPAAGQSYAAYRITASAGSARRLDSVLSVSSGASPSATTVDVSGDYGGQVAIDSQSVVLDAALDDLSAGQLVAVVDWSSGADVVTVAQHVPVHWETAPGNAVRASKLRFADDVNTLSGSAGKGVTVYVLDRRVAAQHYVFPHSDPGETPATMRLYPAPTPAPAPRLSRVAVNTSTNPSQPAWQLAELSGSTAEPATDAHGNPVPAGLIVTVTGPPPAIVDRAPASGNLVRVRHGATASAVLGGGNPLLSHQTMAVPDAPVAYDTDDEGNVVPSTVVRVDGVAWPEVDTLYATGPVQEYARRIGPGGAVTVMAGDGTNGQRLPRGRGNVTATYRVGGGRAGEVPGGAIDSLVGSVRGVSKVSGAGPTSGGSDQDDDRRLRALAPARARGFGRVVSEGDLVDLTLAFPGVSHAAAWHGVGPPGCACSAIGLHLAFLRASSAGPRPPLPAEVDSLSAYLDNRRDTTVALCVCGGIVTTLTLTATLAVGGRRQLGAVVAAVQDALSAPDGSLDPAGRDLGQPVDHSDVVAVMHAVPGVLGVTSFALTGATVPGTAGAAQFGRQPAARFELMVLATPASLSAVPG